MAVNKVIYGAMVLIDLTGDTVTPETLAEGVIAHDATGAKIVGTAKLKPAYTNLVPTSTDTDGSIYNGVGYKENVRLSSSGGLSGSAQNGSVTTGFMPYSSLGVIRIKGAVWVDTAAYGHYYVHCYDANKTFKSGIAATDPVATTVATYDADTGVTTIDIGKLSESYLVRQHFEEASYIRINAYGKGTDLIITVNEEIT